MGRILLLGGCGIKNAELLARARVLHRAAFTQRSFTESHFHTEKLVHREDFLHTEAEAFIQTIFTHESYTHSTQKLLHEEFLHRVAFNIQKSLLREVLTQKTFFTQKLYFCTRKPL